MGKISSEFGTGGANLDPSGGDSLNDSLPVVLRDIADDLAALSAKDDFPNLTSPVATDLASAILLVNEIRTKWNAVTAVTIKTVKT